MKIHSIVISTVLSTLLLAASQAHGIETASTDLICAHAKLTNLITNGTLEQFKNDLEQELAHVKSTSSTAATDLRKSLSNHATTLRTQKLTQLAKTMSKNRIWAGVKAGAFGLIACQKVRGAFKHRNTNDLADKESWQHLCEAVIVGDMFTGSSRALVFDLATLLISSIWAYENAHFAYYGTKPLLADIKRLDDIIVHLEQAA